MRALLAMETIALSSRSGHRNLVEERVAGPARARRHNRRSKLSSGTSRFASTRRNPVLRGRNVALRESGYEAAFQREVDHANSALAARSAPERDDGDVLRAGARRLPGRHLLERDHGRGRAYRTGSFLEWSAANRAGRRCALRRAGVHAHSGDWLAQSGIRELQVSHQSRQHAELRAGSEERERRIARHSDRVSRQGTLRANASKERAGGIRHLLKRCCPRNWQRHLCAMCSPNPVRTRFSRRVHAEFYVSFMQREQDGFAALLTRSLRLAWGQVGHAFAPRAHTIRAGAKVTLRLSSQHAPGHVESFRHGAASEWTCSWVATPFRVQAAGEMLMVAWSSRAPPAGVYTISVWITTRLTSKGHDSIVVLGPQGGPRRGALESGLPCGMATRSHSRSQPGNSGASSRSRENASARAAGGQRMQYSPTIPCRTRAGSHHRVAAGPMTSWSWMSRRSATPRPPQRRRRA